MATLRPPRQIWAQHSQLWLNYPSHSVLTTATLGASQPLLTHLGPPLPHHDRPGLTMVTLGSTQILKAHPSHLWFTKATIGSLLPPLVVLPFCHLTHHGHSGLTTANMGSSWPPFFGLITTATLGSPRLPLPHHNHPGLTMVTLGSPQPPQVHYRHCGSQRSHYSHLWLTMSTIESPQPSWTYNDHRWLITATLGSLWSPCIHH